MHILSLQSANKPIEEEGRYVSVSGSGSGIILTGRNVRTVGTVWAHLVPCSLKSGVRGPVCISVDTVRSGWFGYSVGFAASSCQGQSWTRRGQRIREGELIGLTLIINVNICLAMLVKIVILNNMELGYFAACPFSH